jgi:hypothetical protein
LWSVLLCLLLAAPASAQVRTFNVEDAAPLAAGTATLSIGASWGHDHVEPTYGLRGTLLQAPIVEGAVSLAGVAELQVSGGLKTLWIDDRFDGPMSSVLDIPGDRSSAPQDVVVATKVRLCTARGARPAMSARLATKLPNAGNESGLGSDTTDFALQLLATWRTAAWRVSAHLGAAVVGDPSQLGVQHDPTLYGLGVARSIAARLEVVGEVSGHWLPGHPRRPGSEDRADARVGVRRTSGRWHTDLALVAGLTSIDASVGAALTVARTFGLGAP